MSKKSYVIDVSKLDSLSEITVDDILEPHVLVFYGNLIGFFTKAHKDKNRYNASLENTESGHADNLLSALVSRLVDIDKKTLFFGAQEVLTYWRSLFVEIFGIVPENLTPIENAKERKDIKVWWVNGYKDNIRLAVKTDDNINIKEIVADNIRFMYPSVRPRKLKHADVQTFYDNEAKSITKFVKYAWGKNVKINKIIGNPPFNVGSQIVHAMIKHCMGDDTVASIIGPLSMYKSNDNYRHIENFGLVAPEMFEDADITNNLCICTLRNHKVDRFKTYEELSMESYDPKFKAFYEYNKAHKVLDWHSAYKKDYQTLNIDTDFVELDRLADAKGGSGYGTGGCGYKWNVLKDGYQDCWAASIVCIHFETPKQKNNFASWWYQGAKGKSFSSRVNLGLNSRTPSFLAIPQIDWEAISDTQLWKEGKYDEAVLDVMGLKWNDDKSGVVKK